jgi:hypothetical protein
MDDRQRSRVGGDGVGPVGVGEVARRWPTSEWAATALTISHGGSGLEKEWRQCGDWNGFMSLACGTRLSVSYVASATDSCPAPLAQGWLGDARQPIGQHRI